MYQGYPDFQQMLTSDKQRLVASYQQAGNWYVYPENLAILSEQPLAFALDVVLSYSEEFIYGRLDFTPVLQYASPASLDEFRQHHPGDRVQILPIQPGYLGFSPPRGMSAPFTAQHYEAVWYSAQDIQFMLLLDSDNTQLIERTLRDNIIGFSARMDGYVTGVSPRLDYTISCDAAALIGALAAGIKESHILPDGNIAFNYAQLTEYLFEHLFLLPLQFDPLVREPDVALVRLLSETLLDRLFNRFGAQLAGSATDNQCWISLSRPAAGREIFDLQREVLTQRPLCFQFDPFTAAQQIAGARPDEIIHRITAPPIPADHLAITLIYVWPEGLSPDAALDVQVRIPPGNLYPQQQSLTQSLRPDASQLAFLFRNNSSQPNGDYHYQPLLTVFGSENHLNFPGVARLFHGSTAVVDYRLLPVGFFRLEADSELLQHSRLTGTFSSGEITQDFILDSENPAFCAPQIAELSLATVVAHQLEGDGQVILPDAITQSGRIGLASFPQYGAHQATIQVQLPAHLTSVTLFFVSEEGLYNEANVFTHQQPEFIYHWRVSSLYHSRYRYRIGDNGAWSAWVAGNQTIMIGAE
ncbi:hypothetical protein [Pantoea sp. A4]|uniref:hypothetical protein n=1 Tax=Pantoea sp. A4 TaxID=1225184 RepID=UPI0003620AF6|nr:hypothetical protein [Pantoea sp. A4]